MNPWVLTLNLELWNIELASAFERSAAVEPFDRTQGGLFELLEPASVLNWLNDLNILNYLTVGFGPLATVLEPSSLIKEIKDDLTRALNAYPKLEGRSPKFS
jgi:predicted DNA-binding transcriptional regulator YafY